MGLYVPQQTAFTNLFERLYPNGELVLAAANSTITIPVDLTGLTGTLVWDLVAVVGTNTDAYVRLMLNGAFAAYTTGSQQRMTGRASTAAAANSDDVSVTRMYDSTSSLGPVQMRGVIPLGTALNRVQRIRGTEQYADATATGNRVEHMLIGTPATGVAITSIGFISVLAADGTTTLTDGFGIGTKVRLGIVA